MGIYEQLQRAKERQRSTATRKDELKAPLPGMTETKAGAAGTQALPVDTHNKPKIGRPKTDFDRTEYQKLYMRDKATIKRLGLNCTVAEYRESLK